MTDLTSLKEAKSVFQYMPPMLLIYGRNGIGKSYFASQFKNPVFLDLDKNIYELSVDSNRSFGIELESITDVLDFLNRLINEEHEHETIVIDSLSSLERLIERHILKTKNAKSLADFQYGQGYQMMMPLWEQFLSKIMALRTQRKLTVLMLGHYKEKRDPNLLGVGYQQYQIDLYEKNASRFSVWLVVTRRRRRPRRSFVRRFHFSPPALSTRRQEKADVVRPHNRATG